ncbi:MAG: radical SAM protein [Dehalococcoidales bacterium]|nr:MAG: radical SAM protein [Dehalococcoidales bacterium]
MKAAVIMDMYGCPNRCRHCWLKHDKNANTPVDEFIWLAEQFKSYERDGKPLFEELVFNTWYREPDFPDNYRELWELENQLSTGKVPRFELASVWRLVRDKDYAPWLKELGVDCVQLSLFGTEENTDYFRGRKGAYREHMQAIDILLENGIVPRIQIFPFSTNIDDINRLYQVLKDIRLEERVNDIGKEFSCFLNTTSPIGEGFNLEDIRLRRSDIPKLPEYLIEKTLKHYNAESTEVHWRTEAELLPELMEENSPLNEESEILAFMVDADFNVYPNFGEIAVWWCLGNAKKDGVGKIIDTFISRNNLGMKMNFEILVKYFAEKYGKQDNERLWVKVDLVQKWHRLEAMNNKGEYLW